MKTIFGTPEETNPADSIMDLIAKEIKTAEKQKDKTALGDWLDLGYSMLEKLKGNSKTESFKRLLEQTLNPPRAPEEDFPPETSAAILNSGILLCDVVVYGKNAAIGLKYDEENMFAPMIVFLEKDMSARALVRASENLGVAALKNENLARNLSFYGKAGKTIPEASYRDASLALARSAGGRNRRRPPEINRGARRQKRTSVIPRPLSLELGESLYALTGEAPGRETLLDEPLNAQRKKLAGLLGFHLPCFSIRRSARLKNDEYRILFKGLEAGRGRLELGWYLPPELEAPRLYGADSEGKNRDDNGNSSAKPSVPPARPSLAANPEAVKNAAKFAASMLVRHAADIIQQRAAELLGRDQVEAILDAAEEKYPVVTGEVRSLLSLGIIREILQSLVSEQVSIKHMAVILETLADWGSLGPAPSEIIIEQIRQSLKRQICMDYADDQLTLRVLTLDKNIDKSFADHSRNFSEADLSAAAFMEPRPAAAEPEQRFPELPEDWTDVFSSAVAAMKEKGFPPVVLCSPRARFLVKEATRRKLPDLAVLSYLEIPPDISVEPMGEIHPEGIRYQGHSASPGF